MYLQWEAMRQLEAASEKARAAGLEFRFYRDLAVGAARDSAEAWGDQALTVASMSIGAPPDQFSADGQNWGLPPWNPRVLRERDYEPFAALLAANMAAAGALRIDHVMALTRLFWIPDGVAGAAGAYVRQPFDALTAAVANASREAQCLVVGEDLGSVPEGLREQLSALGFLSYRVLLFERHWQGDGTFKRPHEYPGQALATVMTHDLPTIADYWTFGDIARRASLGLFADAAARERAIAERHEERWKILALLTECALLPADPEDAAGIAEALHTFVARTPSMLAIVQLDDVLGETEPANIPGTDREYPNWRRKLSRTLEEIDADPRLARLGLRMRESGRT
jgi:4-alpha-glucanotransferase